MKTYVICTTLENDTFETLKKLGSEIDLKQVMVHIVQIVEIQTYSTEFISTYYPTENDYGAIEKNSFEIMKRIAASIGLDEDKVLFKCLFEINREARIIRYLNEVKADLVITATRGKHGIDGFFSSSFTDFLCKFSPCDILVMRPIIKK